MSSSDTAEGRDRSTNDPEGMGGADTGAGAGNLGGTGTGDLGGAGMGGLGSSGDPGGTGDLGGRDCRDGGRRPDGHRDQRGRWA